MNKLIILAVIVVIVSIGSVCFVTFNNFSQNPEATPQSEPQPTPRKVELNSEVWYDGSSEGEQHGNWWIELRNQYSVKASNLKLVTFYTEMIWNDEQEDWERVRMEKETPLPFTLEPNETVSFFIQDYCKDFVISYRDPPAEVYGYVIL